MVAIADGTIKKKIANCVGYGLHLPALICTKCSTGTLIGNACVIGKGAGCKTYNNNVTCVTCEATGFASAKLCVNCIENCDKCTTAG